MAYSKWFGRHEWIGCDIKKAFQYSKANKEQGWNFQQNNQNLWIERKVVVCIDARGFLCGMPKHLRRYPLYDVIIKNEQFFKGGRRCLGVLLIQGVINFLGALARSLSFGRQPCKQHQQRSLLQADWARIYFSSCRWAFVLVIDNDILHKRTWYATRFIAYDKHTLQYLPPYSPRSKFNRTQGETG